jgi:tRNA-Thr(GGU) m(6)t(6)A37 methyltransferase TsaA
VEVFPEFVEGLQDLEGFSHLIPVYHFDIAKPYNLTVLPFMDSVPRGVFATRASSRPNPIGLSVVRLISREANTLTIQEVDNPDGTPLLDIEPYFEEADVRRNTRKGWLEGTMKGIHRTGDDSRFVQEHGNAEEDGWAEDRG